MAAYVSNMTKRARKMIEQGVSVPKACKTVGIARQTIYISKWWQEFKERKGK